MSRNVVVRPFALILSVFAINTSRAQPCVATFSFSYSPGSNDAYIPYPYSVSGDNCVDGQTAVSSGNDAGVTYSATASASLTGLNASMLTSGRVNVVRRGSWR